MRAGHEDDKSDDGDGVLTVGRQFSLVYTAVFLYIPSSLDG